MKMTIYAALAMCATAFFTNGCMQQLNDKLGQDPDWILEEIIEDIWNGRTGRNDDFTPESPE